MVTIKQKTKDRTFLRLMLLPTVAFIGVIVLFPLCYSLVLSFYQWDLLKPSQEREFVGIANYLNLLKDPKFQNSLLVTIKYVFAVVVFEFVLGLLLATALYSLEEKKGNLFKTLYILPIAVPLIVAGLAWRWMYHPQAGIVPLIFDIFTSNTPLFLSDPNLSLTAVILVDIWKNTPFMVLILLAGLLNIPLTLYEAAQVDGASRSQIFLYITLPQLKPVMTTVILIRTIDAFKTFDSVWALTQGGPAETTNILNILIYKLGFQFFEMGKATACSWLMLLILGIAILMYLRLLED